MRVNVITRDGETEIGDAINHVLIHGGLLWVERPGEKLGFAVSEILEVAVEKEFPTTVGS